MIAAHANMVLGNRRKMLRLRESGLWIAAPAIAVYPPAFDLADMSKSNHSIVDEEGNQYDLEHMVLQESRWGKCIEYVEH
jgi:hypothetical protein